MADITSLIAQGPGRVDFSALGDLGKSYFEGLNQAYLRRNQNAFANGVPNDPEQVARMAIQAGGAQAVPALAPLLGAQQGMDLLNRVESGNLGPPTANRTVPTAQSSPGDFGSGQTLMGLFLARGLPEDQARAKADAIGGPLGIPSDEPLTPQHVAQIRQRGQPQVTQAPTPEQAAEQPDTRGVGNTVIDPEKERKLKQYTILMGSPNKAVAAAAKARVEALQKQTEPTPLQKEYDLARRQGFSGTMQEFESEREGDKVYQAKTIESNVKKYDQIQTAGERARLDIPQLQVARRLTDDPSFYSGVGEKYNLIMKRLLSHFGANPDVAVPQEAFRKIVSNSIIDQIKGMSGTGAGQIRVAEINIMREAAANPDNSPQANRMLIEIASRVQKRADVVATMAQNYKNGRLDSGFDKQLAEYDRKNPLFTADEIGNFRKIIDAGAQRAPQSTGGQRVKVNSKEERDALPSGTPYTAPDGSPRTRL